MPAFLDPDSSGFMIAMTAMGHEERFPRLKPIGRRRFCEGTFAGTRGKDADAP
jgi:hypothetical protein